MWLVTFKSMISIQLVIVYETQTSDYVAKCLFQLNGKGIDRHAKFVSYYETEGHEVINLDHVSV
jgi:hypothetical protein